MFTGVYGKPALIYTDHAPSLVWAAETHDWEEIGQAVGGTWHRVEINDKRLLLEKQACRVCYPCG